MRAVREWWAAHQEAKEWIQKAVDEDDYGLFGTMDDETRKEIVAAIYVAPQRILRMREAYEEGRTPEAAWQVAKRGST